MRLRAWLIPCGELSRCAAMLREAAELTANESLKRFVRLRSDAFLSNDDYASDVAWMDLDAPLDITMLKNVQEARFERILRPIAARVLGRATTPRQELKDLYSPPPSGRFASA